MLEAIIDFSVRRRWAVLFICLVIGGIGARSLTRIPIDAVPDITNNQVQINTVAPALSPLEIEKQVTFRIETALAGTPGLEYTRSLSRNGFSQITAVFSDSTNIYFARQQVNERLADLRTALPPGAEPHLGPISTGLGEIYMWTVKYRPASERTGRDGTPGLQSDGSYLTPEGQRVATELERAAYLRTVQDWYIRPRLKSVAGVAGVDSIGGYVKQYHVQPNPAKLNAMGLSFEDLARAVEANNISRGATTVENNGEGYVVRATGRLESIADIEDIAVATRASVPVRLRDVADVKVSSQTRTGSGSQNGHEVVVGTALMLIGANSRTVAAAVDAMLAELRQTLPPDVVITTVLNRTQLVDATIATVVTNLSEGALLVIAVLFLFLGNFRAALITTSVIPLTMLITAAGMWQGRISANLMSLGALDFGLLVDGAVIITENGLRRLAARQQELGGRLLTLSERLDTIRGAAIEVLRPSVYGQAIILLVYVPLLTFSGVEGKMFEPMALTVIMALAAAFILSITFVPALVAIALTRKVKERENVAISALKRVYAPLLAVALRRPLSVVAIATMLFAAAVVIFPWLGQEFIPTLDEKNVAMHALRIPATGLNQSQSMQLAIEKAVARFPQVAVVFSKTGTAEIATDPMPPNTSDTFIILKPRSEWPDPSLPKEALVADVQRVVTAIPGNAYEFTQPIQMRFNELLAGVRGDIAVKIFGDEFEPLLRAAEQVAGILRSIPGATDVRVEQVAGLPTLEISPDRVEIARRGLSLAAVQAVIGAAIGGREAGTIYEGDRYFGIVVRLSDAARSDIEALQNLPVPLPVATTAGQTLSIPLSQVARFRIFEGPNQISRENGKRRVVVTANVRGSDIGSVVTEAQALVRKRLKLPPGYWLAWGGQFENLIEARQRLMIVVPACFALILLLLWSALGSGRNALLVFSAVPLGLTGGVFALWLREMPFSISAAVGFIALSGIAVLNGLVMLSFIKQLMEQGRDKPQAIIEGALTRLRPIAMTALVASLGFLPMAIATGTGAEVQRPIATVVIGGLISATLLTLFVLPALYIRFGQQARRPAEATPRRSRLPSALGG